MPPRSRTSAAQIVLTLLAIGWAGYAVVALTLVATGEHLSMVLHSILLAGLTVSLIGAFNWFAAERLIAKLQENSDRQVARLQQIANNAEARLRTAVARMHTDHPDGPPRRRPEGLNPNVIDMARELDRRLRGEGDQPDDAG